jgi:hypothetical protein
MQDKTCQDCDDCIETSGRAKSEIYHPLLEGCWLIYLEDMNQRNVTERFPSDASIIITLMLSLDICYLVYPTTQKARYLHFVAKYWLPEKVGI